MFGISKSTESSRNLDGWKEEEQNRTVPAMDQYEWSGWHWQAQGGSRFRPQPHGARQPRLTSTLNYFLDSKAVLWRGSFAPSRRRPEQ